MSALPLCCVLAAVSPSGVSLVTARTPSRRPEVHILVAEVEDLTMGDRLWGGRIAVTATIRQAKLKPECAERYPTLPCRMWTSATCLAELVASYREALPELAGQDHNERTLTESDFEFRGGFCRCSRGLFPRTRIGEPAFS